MVQGHNLHDIGVSDTGSCSMCEGDQVLGRFWLTHQWDDLEDIVVQHEDDESPCLPQEDRIRRLLLIM